MMFTCNRPVSVLEADARQVAAPLALEEIRDATVTPFCRQSPTTITGAVYDRFGRIVPNSLRIGGYEGDNILHDDCAIYSGSAQEREELDCEAHFIGHYFGHYGHFITEGLSALWAAARDRSSGPLLAQKFIFGSTVHDFAAHMFGALGLSPSQIRFVNGPMQVRNLTVPEKAWIPNNSVHPDMLAVVDRISPMAKRKTGKKLFLSRRHVANRQIENECELEEFFKAAGFEVLWPEQMPIKSQLDAYSQAAVIAGLAGSALHNVLFCPSGTIVISIGDARTDLLPNQVVCDTLMEASSVVVQNDARDRRIDIRHVARVLKERGIISNPWSSRLFGWSYKPLAPRRRPTAGPTPLRGQANA